MTRATILQTGRDGLLCGPGDVKDYIPKSSCFFGDVAAAIAAFLSSAPADAAAAAATTAAAAAPEVVTVTAPAITAGITGSELAGAGFTAAAAAAPFIAGAAGATPAAAAPAQQPQPLPTAPLGQPVSTSPAAAAQVPAAPSMPAAATSPPIGGPGASAVANAPPPSVAGGPPPSPAQDLSIGGGGQTSLGTPAATSPGAAAGAGPSPGETSLVNAANANLAANPAPVAGSEAPAAPSGISGALKGASGFLKDNSQILSLAAAAGGLGYDLLNANKPLPNQTQLQTNANQLNASAQQLQNYINSGTLPPGIQDGINQASEAAKAAIRSQYASMGDTGSSAEAQDLSAVDARAATQGGQLALNLLQQGISEQGMADTLYQDLMNTALQQDQALGTAIGTFASALVPTTPTIKLAA